MKSPIKIKVEDSEIVISKPFAKKAYSFGTPEYEMLQAVRRDYPGFAVVLREIKKKTDAEHYKGLNYKYMKWYIEKYETAEKKAEMKKALDEMIDISKCHSTGKRYATIRNWFLETYPAVKEFGMPKEEKDKSKPQDTQPQQNQVVPLNAATNQAAPAA